MPEQEQKKLEEQAREGSQSLKQSQSLFPAINQRTQQTPQSQVSLEFGAQGTHQEQDIQLRVYNSEANPFKAAADGENQELSNLTKLRISSKKTINPRTLKQNLSRNSLQSIQSQTAGGTYSFKRASTLRANLPPSKRAAKQVQMPGFNISLKVITPKNEDFLISCFNFFANVRYPKADEHLTGVLFKAVNVLQTYGVSGYQNVHPDQVRLSLFCKISDSLLRILNNTCISSVSHSLIIDLICNTSNNFSLAGLIRLAIDNKIDPDTDQGHSQMTLMLSQLPLIDKLQAYQRTQLLQLLLKKLTSSNDDAEIDLLHIFKMPNRQVLLLLLTQLITRADFKSINQSKASQQYVLTNSQIRDMMGVCLKAVSHFFEDKKNFESLIIYLKLAFKIFVCVGVEGSQNILGGRSLSEFVIYFLMKSLDQNTPRLDSNQFAIFINIYLDSIGFLIKQNDQNNPNQSRNHQESQDASIIMEAFEIFALFTPQFNNLNKNLFEILRAQIAPSSRPISSQSKHVVKDEQMTSPSGELPGEAAAQPPHSIGHNQARSEQASVIMNKQQSQSNIDSSRLYQTITNLGIHHILVASMHTLIKLELSSILSSASHVKPSHSLGANSLLTEQSLGPVHHVAGQTIQNSVSLRFYSNIVRYTMDLNFENAEGKFHSKTAKTPKIEAPAAKSCSQILSTTIDLSRTIIDHLKQEQNPSSQIIRSNLQMISQKFFHCLGVLEAEGKDSENKELFELVFSEYIEFILYDVSSLQVSNKDQSSQQFGELMQNFIIDPLVKALKKVRLMNLFAPCTKVLVRQAQKIKKSNSGTGRDRGQAFCLLNEYENQSKLLWMILQILSSQQSEMNQQQQQEPPQAYLLQGNVFDAQHEAQEFAKILDCIYDIMVVMGAPRCFMDAGEKAGDHKNSQEVMYLWAHIMLFVQKAPNNNDKIAAQINKLASISSCLLFDQDFSMKMRVTNQKFKDIEDLISENISHLFSRKHFEKYPQLLQSLDLMLTMRKERKDETQPKQANASPSKSEIIKKVEKAKMRKTQGKIKAEEVQNQQEQELQEEEKQDEDSCNEEVDPHLASQQLNNNELLFIEMFILMSEARINFFKTQASQPSSQENNDANIQNFVESILIIFNNYQIDQDNLQQKLESIVKVMISEYIDTMRNFSQVNLKNVELEKVVSQDVQVLLKARIHLNKQMSHVAGFMLKKYVEAFPLVLREFRVQQTLLDCIQIMSESLSREYESIVKPVCLKTLSEYVFLPADHERVKLMLTQMVALYSDLFIYASIYDKAGINQNIIRYKSLINSSVLEDQDRPCAFQLQMHDSLSQSFNLNKMKLNSDKNLLVLRSLFILDPSQAISEINKVKQLETGNAANNFFLSQLGPEIFQLGSLENIKDSNISLSKISPFVIHNQELAAGQRETILTLDPKTKSIDKQMFELQAQVLKHIMKIDMASQLQYLQKSHPIEHILGAITKEQLKVKALQIKRKYEQQQEMKSLFNSMAQANDASLNIYIKNKMKSLQLVTKMLQNLDKQPYILKQCMKIDSIVQQMAKLTEGSDLEDPQQQQMRRHQATGFVICALSTCLEAPLVGILRRFIHSSPNHDLCQIFARNMNRFTELMISRMERKKSLKSKPKEVKQNVLTNQFGEQMNYVQQYNQIQGLFEMIDLYDSNIFNLKSMKETNEIDQFDESFAGLKSSEMDQQSQAIMNNSLEVMKFASNFNQQCQSTKVLKYFAAWLDLMMDLYNNQSAERHQHKLRLSIAKSYRNFIARISPIMFNFVHKKGFLKVCLNCIKFGLTMARFEGISKQSQNKIHQEERYQLLKACFEILIKLAIKQKKIIMRRATLTKLKEELQLLEDIRYLINQVNIKNTMNSMQIPFALQQDVSFLELPQIKNTILLSTKDFEKLGTKTNFVRIKQLQGNLVIVTVKEKYSKIVQQQSTMENTFLNNLMIDQLNHLKYSLLGNNFYQKQMADIQVKTQPLVSSQLIREKYESLLYSEPKLLELGISVHDYKEVLKNILQTQFKESKNILQKVFWKSEHVLDILMKTALEIKDITAEPTYRKSLSVWRNRYVSRMVSFVGYKYSGQHFLHSVALKPFYASSSKITIFYLSQIFQSLRWDTNFQLHRLLAKKSQTMPSIAHNVIWFCRVESFVDAQPQRKVPLPITENLDIQSKKLANLIFRKMTAVEADYFNTETNFLEKITSISGVLKPSQSKDEKKAIIREKLIQYNKEIPDNIYLPTNQKCRVVGIVTSSGQPMQSAARVPILVSFEVQEYEGPDSDPTINRGRQPVQVNESNSIIPSKQDAKLQAISESLSQALLKINSISFDKRIGDVKMQEELRDQLFQQQLQNYQNIGENLMEMLNEEYEFRQSMLDNQADFNQVTFNYSKKFKAKNLFSDSHQKSSLQNHLAQIQKQPTLKIKMSQYSFQTKQNPLSIDEAHPFVIQATRDSNISNEGQRKTSTSIFAKNNQDNFLDLRKPKKLAAIQGLKKSKLTKIDEANSNEMNDSFVSQSQHRMISEVSDSDSIYDYGKRNSPYKNLMRKSSLKKRFKSSIHFQSISLNTNMRGLGQSMLKTGSSYATSSHHVSYKPSIFAPSAQFGAMQRIDNSVSNGINLVLQFEQQILESQQKKHQYFDGDSRNVSLQGNGQAPSSSRAPIQKEGQDQSLTDSRQISQSQGVMASQGPRKDMNKPTRIVSCIFKVNDDLRQDILALQFIKLFQKIFKKCNLDLYVAPYKCISNRTGAEQLLGGIIEVVPNSNSRDQIGKAFEIDLYDYFLKKYGNESSKAFQQARLNFIKSLAAYSVVSFILQIKDRHNGNILIDDQGSIVHIDFGFIFDWSPGKDMRFESANFKMTKEFIKILGGSEKAEPYQLFVQKTIQGYLAVREHHRDFMNLVELMSYSGFPCFKQISVQTLQQRFRMEGDQACANQFEAAMHMRSIIEDAHDKWTTTAYDMIQYKQNKIVF